MAEEVKLPNREVFCYLVGSPYYLNSSHPHIMARNWLELGKNLGILGEKKYGIDFDEIKANPEYNRVAREFIDRTKAAFMKDVEDAPVKLVTQEYSLQALKGSKYGKTLVECLFAYEGNQEEATKLFEEILEEKKAPFNKRSIFSNRRRGRSGNRLG